MDGDYGDKKGLLDDSCNVQEQSQIREWLEREKARRTFLDAERDAYDCRLEELRKAPQPGGIALPSAEEMAWMSDEERLCVEWFDRHDYDTFMKRSAWYEGDGWIVPYCRQVCADRCGMVSRYERFLRVADKMFVAAKAGNVRAQNAVGTFCERNPPLYGKELLQRNLGIEGRDLVAARKWYRKSAEGGCIQGIRNYARVLRYGIGGTWYLPDGSFNHTARRKDKSESEKWYVVASERGDGDACYTLACMHANGTDFERNAGKSAWWLLQAAEVGHKKAEAVITAANGDLSPERLCAELIIAWAVERRQERESRYDDCEEVAFCVGVPDDLPCDGGGHGQEWLLKGTPEGTVMPPPANRETVRTPNLTSANPSFAARLIILVRDRFRNNAPGVYHAAHVSRKTYSAIVSNELRPVSKQTAVAFTLALRLPLFEADVLLKSAGFSLSDFILEDMIVKACIQTGIYGLDKVNEILAAHGAKTFPKSEEAS